MHASSDSPCHSSAKPPPLGGLPPPHGAFQEHAAHLVEWSTTLSSKGSAGTCIPAGVTTFFHAAFTAHSEARVDAGRRRLHALVRPGPRILCACPRCPPHAYWITSSARRSRAGGIVIPSALAVLRLMINSNFMGCSTGRSAGLAPLRILSTKTAARLKRLVSSCP